jgi:hypothetical protein
MANILVIHFLVSDHHPRWWTHYWSITQTSQLVKRLSQGHALPTDLARGDLTWADASPHEPSDPARSQPHVTHPFRDSLNHLWWNVSYFLGLVSYFATSLLQYSAIVATMLSHFSEPSYFLLLQYSVIFHWDTVLSHSWCYSTLPFST